MKARKLIHYLGVSSMTVGMMGAFFFPALLYNPPKKPDKPVIVKRIDEIENQLTRKGIREIGKDLSDPVLVEFSNLLSKLPQNKDYLRYTKDMKSYEFQNDEAFKKAGIYGLTIAGSLYLGGFATILLNAYGYQNER